MAIARLIISAINLVLRIQRTRAAARRRGQ